MSIKGFIPLENLQLSHQKIYSFLCVTIQVVTMSLETLQIW